MRVHGWWIAVAAAALAGCADGPSAPLREPPADPPVVGPDGVPHVFVSGADGSGATQLVAGNWPAWSPDGRRLALHRDGFIYVMNADGSQEQQLKQGGFAAWSPNGVRIAYASEEGIALMDADGGRVATLISHGFRTDIDDRIELGVGKPAWSPDGTRIAFEHFGDGLLLPSRIYVMKADGSEVRRLTARADTSQVAEFDPVWSPDGARIAFWSPGDGIMSVAVAGGLPAPIFDDSIALVYAAKPSWFNDRIAFNTTPLAETGPSLIVVAHGGPANVLIRDAYHAAWTRDRSRIAFVRNR